MRAASSCSWTCYAICLFCALMIQPVQDGFESRRGEPEPDADLLYFNSPALVKKMALGYDGVVSDLYWMRSIQYYGRRAEADKRPIRFKNLSRLLEITTTLDPGLLDAYHAGSIFLSEPEPVGAGQPREAINLLDRGIRANPREWRIAYDKGLIYYLFLKNYRAAADTWLQAAKIPGSPLWMESLAAWSLSKGGSLEMAAMLWRRQYEQATRADIKENAHNHLISIEVDMELAMLRSAISDFRQKRGIFPWRLRDISVLHSGKIAIMDPSGVPYDYDAKSGTVGLSPDTRVRYLNTR